MDDFIEFTAIPHHDPDEVDNIIRDMGIKVEHDDNVDYDRWIE